MINLGIVVVFLSTFGGEEDFGYTLSAECGDEVAIVVQRAIVQNTFHQQGIADVLLFLFGRVPEKCTIILYELLTSHNQNLNQNEKNYQKSIAFFWFFSF